MGDQNKYLAWPSIDDMRGQILVCIMSFWGDIHLYGHRFPDSGGLFARWSYIANSHGLAGGLNAPCFVAYDRNDENRAIYWADLKREAYFWPLDIKNANSNWNRGKITRADYNSDVLYFYNPLVHVSNFYPSYHLVNEIVAVLVPIGIWFVSFIITLIQYFRNRSNKDVDKGISEQKKYIPYLKIILGFIVIIIVIFVGMVIYSQNSFKVFPE